MLFWFPHSRTKEMSFPPWKEDRVLDLSQAQNCAKTQIQPCVQCPLYAVPRAQHWGSDGSCGDLSSPTLAEWPHRAWRILPMMGSSLYNSLWVRNQKLLHLIDENNGVWHSKLQSEDLNLDLSVIRMCTLRALCQSTGARPLPDRNHQSRKAGPEILIWLPWARRVN